MTRAGRLSANGNGSGSGTSHFSFLVSHSSLLSTWWLPVLSSRLLLIAVVAVGLHLVPVTSAPFGVRALGTPSPISAFPDLLLLDGWARWDSAWYFSVASDGYYFDPGVESNVAFFPLYPLLVGALATPLEASLGPARAFYLVGVLVSLSAFAFAVARFRTLARRLIGPDDARRATWALCLAPWSLFFGAAYSEALFLLLAIGATADALEGRFFRASLFAAGAALCRSVGLVVSLIVIVEYLASKRRPRDAVWLTLPFVAVLGHAAYLGFLVGDPLAFLHVQDAPLWGRTAGLPPIVQTISAVLDPKVPFDTRVALLTAPLGVAGALVLSIIALARVRVSLGVFGLVSLAAVLSAGSWDSAGRYTAVLFPAFLALAVTIRHRALFVALLGASTALLVFNAFGFSHWRQPF
ncbi:MAG: hypothetical protein HYV07_21935 [Deltaproteobacteria bacterium]|nr:hypothetical protein [Deltaproteobacteria bacterium]